MTVVLAGVSWGWNDSGHLQIAQPAGLQAGDMVFASVANHADSNVGAGFVQDAGMPAVTDLFLFSYPHPGTGGTLQFKYWNWANTDPATYGWTCAAIFDVGVVFALRPDAGTPTAVAHSNTSHAASTSSQTTAVTGAASEFLIGVWYTATGGATRHWTGDPSICTIANVISPGTLPLTMLIQVGTPPVGAFTKTATLDVQDDTLANMTLWTGDLKNPCVAPMLPITGVGP